MKKEQDGAQTLFSRQQQTRFSPFCCSSPSSAVRRLKGELNG